MKKEHISDALNIVPLLVSEYRLNGRCPVRILGQYEYNIRRYACHRHCSCHLYCHTYCQARWAVGVAVQAAAEV